MAFGAHAKDYQEQEYPQGEWTGDAGVGIFIYSRTFDKTEMYDC
jgi:hypothetical protein